MALHKASVLFKDKERVGTITGLGGLFRRETTDRAGNSHTIQLPPVSSIFLPHLVLVLVSDVGGIVGSGRVDI